jgi:hypothetical protein
MVNPISFPTPQAYSAGADFTPLANLGNVYQKAQEQARQQEALASLGLDPEANAQILTGSGVLPLAQLGLSMQDKSIARQREDAANALAQSNWQQQQAIRAAQEKRAAETFEEDSPEGRRKKLVEAGVNPDDPAYTIYRATGEKPPSIIQQQAERRAQITFDQQQKYATREQRLQAVKDGELNIDDPEIRRWVALGGEIPDPAKQRLGLGTPTFTQDTDGTVHAWQLSANGTPVEVKVPQGQTILGPGQLAQQKAEGAAVGKATGAAKVALPDIVRNLDATDETLDKIINHPGKSMALGRGSQIPEWMVAGTDIGDFREQVKRLSGEAMAQTMASLKGAGLGSVSDFEQKTMIAAFVAAGMAQTQKQFDDSMQTAKRSLDKIREIARAKAKGDFSEKPGTQPAATEKPDPLGLR